jgi:SAM-dependent methyltransferase
MHSPHAHEGGPGHHGQGFHRRFDDPVRWSAVFDDPARDAWQRPDDVLRWLALAPDARVADLGAGTGYFSVRLARAVPSGRVWAEDIEPTLVAHMRARVSRDVLANVFPVLGTTEDPMLPEPVDLVLVVDTYHHISDRPAFFRRLHDRLRPNGRLVIVDFRESSPMGPPREHRLSPETVTRELAEAGYRASGTYDSLPNQYVLAFVHSAAE